MADSRISNLLAGTPAASDVFPYTNGTTTYRVAFGNAKSAIMGTTDNFVMNFIIGNAGTTAISQTGLYPYWSVNMPGSITGFQMLSGTINGNATINIYKGNYGTPPTGTAQSIIGSTLAMTGTSKYQGTTTSWATKTFNAGDVFAVNLNGVGTISNLSLMIFCRKTA